MAGNRAVAYKGPGKVEVIDIDYPEFELKDGPGVNPANVGREGPARRSSSRPWRTNICGSDQHMVRGRTTAPRAWSSVTRSPARSSSRPRTSSSSRSGDIVSVPFNIACGRCRNCKEGKTGICLNVNPDRPGLRLRLRRHGRLGRRPGRVRPGALRRLEPAEVPGPGPGPGEDHGPDHALGHLPDRLPRRASRQGSASGSTVYIAGAGPVGLAAAASAHLLGAAVSSSGTCRGPPGPGPQLRLRDRRRLARATSPSRSSRSSACRRSTAASTPSGSRPAATAQDASTRDARDRAQLAHGRSPRAGGGLGIPGLYVTGDPGRGRRRGKEGSLSIRLGLGWAKSLPSHGPVPGDEVQPAADDGDPARQGADRQGRQRQGDPAQRRPAGLRGVRRRRRDEVRPQPQRVPGPVRQRELREHRPGGAGPNGPAPRCVSAAGRPRGRTRGRPVPPRGGDPEHVVTPSTW